MSCEQIREDLVPYLLSELSPDAAHCIERHLSDGCASCRDEFDCIREAVSLVFEAVPTTRLTTERQQIIAQRAVRGVQPSWSTNARALSASSDALPLLPTLPRATTAARLLPAILAVAAGFFVMLGAQAILRSVKPTGTSLSERNASRLDVPQRNLETFPRKPSAQRRENSLAGDFDLLPGSHNAVRFVSLKVQPTQPALVGFFLADPFSGELHIVGHIFAGVALTPQPNQRFSLTIATDQTRIEVPLEVDADGGFKLIMPLPQHSIRDVVLQINDVST